MSYARTHARTQHAAGRRGEAWAAARLQRQVVLDVDDEHVGKLVEAMNARKAELVNMDVSKQGPNKTRIEYTVGPPARPPAAPLPTVPHLPVLSEPKLASAAMPPLVAPSGLRRLVGGCFGSEQANACRCRRAR